MWPSEGIAAPVPNSSRLKGRSAAAWRVTLIDCARSQGNNTGAGPATTFGRWPGDRCARKVVSGSVWSSVAIVSHLKRALLTAYRNTCPQQRQYAGAGAACPAAPQTHCPPTDCPYRTGPAAADRVPAAEAPARTPTAGALTP